MIRKNLILLIPLKTSYPVNKRNIDERCSIFCLYLLTHFTYFFHPPLLHFWQPPIFSNLFSVTINSIVAIVCKISYITEINLIFVFLCLTCFTQHHALEVRLLSQMAIFHSFFMASNIPLCVYIYTHTHVQVYTHTYKHTHMISYPFIQ